MDRSILLFCFAASSALMGCSESSSDGGSSGGSSSSSSSGSSSGNYQPPPVSTVDGGADPKTGEVRYLAMGDSLTEGVGAQPSPETGSFPAQLTAKWKARGCNVTLTNAGIAGYTAEAIIADELPQVATVKPTIITFQTGANDIANGVTKEQYRANIRKILTTSVASGARVIAMPENEWFRSPQGMQYGDNAEKRAEFDQVMIEEAAAAKAEFVDLRAMFKRHADANMWIDDGLHPTPAAYTEWANELARVVPSPCGK